MTMTMTTRIRLTDVNPQRTFRTKAEPFRPGSEVSTRGLTTVTTGCNQKHNQSPLAWPRKASL